MLTVSDPAEEGSGKVRFKWSQFFSFSTCESHAGSLHDCLFNNIVVKGVHPVQIISDKT
jgi:hypothetical protein